MAIYGNIVKKTYTQKKSENEYTPIAFKTTADQVYINTANRNSFEGKTVETKFQEVDTEFGNIKTQIGFTGAGEEITVVKSIILNGTQYYPSGATGSVSLTGVATSSDIAEVQTDVARINTTANSLNARLTVVKTTADNAIPQSNMIGGYDSKTKKVAFVDQSGKIPTSLLPETITGQLYFKGVFYNVTNGKIVTSPSDNSVGTSLSSVKKGDFYICAKDITDVSALKTTGITFIRNEDNFNTGDWLVCTESGTGFAKVDNTDAISSVNGRKGAISLRKVKDDDSTTTAYSLVENGGKLILPSVSGQQGSHISVSYSGNAVSSGRTYTVYVDNGYQIPSTTDISTWNSKPNKDTKLSSFNGAKSGTTGYLLTLKDDSNTTVTHTIPAIGTSSSATVGLVSYGLSQDFGTGKSFTSAFKVVDENSSSNYLEVGHDSSEAYMLWKSGETSKKFKLPSSTGTLATEQYATTNYLLKSDGVSSGDNYYSAFKLKNGQVVNGGQMIVSIGSLTDTEDLSTLADLVLGGFALIG